MSESSYCEASLFVGRCVLSIPAIPTITQRRMSLKWCFIPAIFCQLRGLKRMPLAGDANEPSFSHPLESRYLLYS